MPPRDPDGPSRPSRLRVVSFNCWVGQRAENLRNNLIDLAEDTESPHVLALQECRSLRGTIPGYERHAVDEPGNPFARRTVFLVRRQGVTVHQGYDIDVGGPAWRGPKGGKQPPRDFPVLTIETEADEQRWDLVDIHRAWTARYERNMGSYTAEHEALVDLADRRDERVPDRPLILVGDWNGRAGDRHRLSPRGLAKRIDAEVVLRGIDGALVRDCTATARKLRGRYGSNAHRPVVVTVTANR